MNVKLFSTLILVTLSSCSTKTTNTIYCEEPRLKICTMDYQPVCGKIDKEHFETYSNACVACSDAKVVSYVKHQCQADISK